MEQEVESGGKLVRAVLSAPETALGAVVVGNVSIPIVIHILKVVVHRDDSGKYGRNCGPVRNESDIWHPVLNHEDSYVVDQSEKDEIAAKRQVEKDESEGKQPNGPTQNGHVVTRILKVVQIVSCDGEYYKVD